MSQGKTVSIACPRNGGTVGITNEARISEDSYYATVPQAMRTLGCGRSRLLTLVIAGDLKARQVAGQLFIEVQSLTEHARQLSAKSAARPAEHDELKETFRR